MSSPVLRTPFLVWRKPWTCRSTTCIISIIWLCWCQLSFFGSSVPRGIAALFAKPWMAALNIVPGAPKQGLAAGMIASLIGDLLLAFVLLHFILWSEAATFATGAFIGFLSWLGFFAATQFAQGIYEHRPFKLFASTPYSL